LSSLGGRAVPLLALTIVWHPDRARVGEQHIGGSGGSGSAGDLLDVNRYAPLFMHPGRDGLPLGHGGISRQPLRFARAGDTVTMSLPASPMVVEVNGREVVDTVVFDAAQLGAGQILTLGRAVVLCLHWAHRLPQANAVPGLAGVGSAAIGVREQIRMVAHASLPVLLLGETGTGKEIAARAIHALGPRAAGPLVAVNMAALGAAQAAVELFGAEGVDARAGVFAQADAATLFLDEIGNAPPAVQPMLLRVLEGAGYRPVGATQDRRSSARLIAATDQELGAAMFNQALLHRLEGFVIRMPPLRARREDIGVLIVHLLDRYDTGAGAHVDLPAALVAALAAHDWPGNIRQLAHALARAVLMLGEGMAPALEHLVRPAGGAAQAPAVAAPAGKSAPVAGRLKPSALSDGAVLEAMAGHAWNIQAAAQALGISRPSLYKLLEDHPVIRRAETIPENDIARAMVTCAGDVDRCAALLQTPAEALRRRWRLLRPA
jgi:two-component system nitrogen regulation response regulator GlnG